MRACNFYTPVFRRDVLWYGDVRPSGSPSVRPSQFSALFSYMLWHIDLKFCVSLYFYARKIKFECHQFPSLFAGVMLLFNFKLLQICSFPHFSPTCFDILSSNFVYDFVLMYHRASLSFVILLQFLLELCLFVNLEYLKYSFPHFSLTGFDILSWNFAYDFVLLYYRSSSSVVNLRQFLLELCPFWNVEYWKCTVFRTFLLHPLAYWAESLHITLFFCTTDQVWVLSILELCLFSNLEYCKYSFPHFSLTCFDILSWNFAHDFVLLYYRSTSSVVNGHQFL